HLYHLSLHDALPISIDESSDLSRNSSIPASQESQRNLRCGYAMVRPAICPGWSVPKNAECSCLSSPFGSNDQNEKTDRLCRVVKDHLACLQALVVVKQRLTQVYPA